MAGQVRSLYRYPIKGLSAQALSSVDLCAGAPFPGDRLYAVEDGPSGFDPERPSFISKSRFAVLSKYPALACVQTRFVDETGCLTLHRSGEAPLVVDLNVDSGRRDACLWLASRLSEESARSALRLVFAAGHRFTDDPAGHVSLVNLSSVQALARRLGRPIDPLRFRANIYVEGWSEWSELSLDAGRRIALGGCVAEVIKPIVRCRAVDVDLNRGERDLDLTAALHQGYGHAFCGLYLKVSTGGLVAAGDGAEAVL
jgi:uncharacterized protein YcbX